jgi:hypothetical protein
LGVSWKESDLLSTELSPEVDAEAKLSDFLFKLCLIFGDLARRGFEVFVTPVKPPMDCED